MRDKTRQAAMRAALFGAGMAITGLAPAAYAQQSSTKPAPDSSGPQLAKPAVPPTATPQPGKSGMVAKPPTGIDPNIHVSPPDTDSKMPVIKPGTHSTMPIIKPPGTPGGDMNVVPK